MPWRLSSVRVIESRSNALHEERAIIGSFLSNWHWKSVRTGSVGQVDDQYVDGTRYDKDKAPEAGHKSDPPRRAVGTRTT